MAISAVNFPPRRCRPLGDFPPTLGGEFLGSHLSTLFAAKLAKGNGSRIFGGRRANIVDRFFSGSDIDDKLRELVGVTRTLA
jgi:hypothetical protein